MDSGVNLVAFARMDGCPVSQPQPTSSLIDDKAQVGRNDVAIKKARTAALFRLPFLPWFTWTCCTFQKKKYRGARYFTELVTLFSEHLPSLLIYDSVLNICQERVGRVGEEDLAWTAGMQLLIFLLATPGVVHLDRELFGQNLPSSERPLGFGILSTAIFSHHIIDSFYRLFYFQDIWPWNRPGTQLSTQLNFHPKKLAHFWMWLGEEAKMGPILSVYYKFFVLMVHLDGYVQRILKT